MREFWDGNIKMKSLRFKKIDAFTNGKSSGNPAGVVYHKPGEIDAVEMQQIARELKGYVNEVIYVSKIGDGDVSGDIELKFQYYSSECEVEFCGHGTIAAMYDLISSDEELRNRSRIYIETNRGVSTVFNYINNDDSLFISAPDPEYIGSDLSVSQVAGALGIEEFDIDEKHKIDVINAGLRTLIVPIKSLKVALNIRPDFKSLQTFCIEQDIDIIIIFTSDVFLSDHKYRTRVFAPRFGYLEDPATGSGNAALGYYLLKNSLWNGHPLSLEQGPELENSNVIKIDSISDKGSTFILFGGRATVRIDGRYLIY